MGTVGTKLVTRFAAGQAVQIKALLQVMNKIRKHFVANQD